MQVRRRRLTTVVRSGKGRADRDTTNDTGYIVSCWRGRLRSCRGFATLGEARQAAAQHVLDAAAVSTGDKETRVDDGVLAAAVWALHGDPEPGRPATRDLADGTKISMRLVSGATARVLAGPKRSSADRPGRSTYAAQRKPVAAGRGASGLVGRGSDGSSSL